MAILMACILASYFTLSASYPHPEEVASSTDIDLRMDEDNVSLAVPEEDLVHSFGHFFNGSYKVYDVLKALQANKTLGRKYVLK